MFKTSILAFSLDPRAISRVLIYLGRGGNSLMTDGGGGGAAAIRLHSGLLLSNRSLASPITIHSLKVADPLPFFTE